MYGGSHGASDNEHEDAFIDEAACHRASGAGREQIEALGVRRLAVFGSVVRGEAGPDSDIDLLVEFDPEKKTLRHFMSLSFLLEEVFQRRIELVTMEALSPYIGPHIL